MLELSFRHTAGFRVTTWGPFLQRRLRSTMPSAMQDAKHSAAKKIRHLSTQCLLSQVMSYAGNSAGRIHPSLILDTNPEF